MCTVTYLPKGRSEYILTSNRDETPKRAALPPKAHDMHGHEVTFPQDPLAGGTWIVTDKQRFTLCLLNGAFVAHKRVPPYKISRGIMVLEFFKYADIDSFIQAYDFKDIEPFTLVMVESGTNNRVKQLIWDGEEAHAKDLDPNEAHIWSSATLYPKAIADQRRQWFSNWLGEHPTCDRDGIIDFHKHGGRGDLWNDFVMKRGDNLQTVSITSIEKDAAGYDMRYEDLVTV